MAWKNIWLIVRRSESNGRDRYWRDRALPWTLMAANAEKFDTKEDAEEVLFNLVTRQPKYIGLVSVIEIVDTWVDPHGTTLTNE